MIRIPTTSSISCFHFHKIQQPVKYGCKYPNNNLHDKRAALCVLSHSLECKTNQNVIKSLQLCRCIYSAVTVRLFLPATPSFETSSFTRTASGYNDVNEPLGVGAYIRIYLHWILREKHKYIHDGAVLCKWKNCGKIVHFRQKLKLWD